MSRIERNLPIWRDRGFGMDERMKDRAFYAFFVGFTPIALFFDALGLLGILRGSLSGSTLTAVAGGLIGSLSAFITRPKIAKAQAWRFVLILLGILVAAAVANIWALILLRNLALAGTIYIGGFVLEFIIANRLLRRAGYLPVRATTR
jgi:hypothetical protein